MNGVMDCDAVGRTLHSQDFNDSAENGSEDGITLAVQDRRNYDARRLSNAR